MKRPHTARCIPPGFSLIELLTVVAIIAIMMSLLAPAISGFSSTAGRRGAVNSLMNTFEQARVAALESGRTVYVLFARPDFPEQDAVMVVRETDTGTGDYEVLSRWRKLPKGVLLHDPSVVDSLLKKNISDSGFDTTRLNVPKLGNLNPTDLKVLAFNDQGAITFPVGKAFRKIILSEGVRGQGGTEALISTRKASAGGFEIISLAQYTGRAQLDVSTLQ
jgi:prepilin-type N-terminal cleavage/methylation domain-containing protein